jgi:ferric-dicitrate binding protein FerR (iron transport regulator)
LSPYQEVAYDKAAGEAAVYPVPECQHAIPWIRDEILFDNDSLSEIASVLERMYNVNIVFEDERITEFTYTGLVRNNSLQNVLDLISGTSPVRYVIEDGTIRFMRK